MKVLSMHPPYPTFVRLGVKPTETRGWQTTYRGPLALATTAVIPGMRRGDVRTIGDFTVERDDPRGSMPAYLLRGKSLSWPYRIPTGCITVTCTLVDVAPIGGPYSFRTGSFEGDEGDFPGRPVVVRHPPLDDWLPERLMLDHGTVTDITDQLPYGDFTPDTGRYAWLLADIKPVDPPVPFKGGQGLSRTWEP